MVAVKESVQDGSSEPKGLQLSALKSLGPYLWPKKRWGLRLRVVLALSFLAAAKIASVYVPILYRDAINVLGGEEGLVVLPLGLILAYGGARISSLLFGELRDWVFAAVGQHAVRAVALGVFKHLHSLSLQFHLDRQTGGLSRSIERGTRGIQTLLSFVLFNILPTLIEIGLVTAVLWTLLDARFALVTITTVVLYIAYTVAVTGWRLKFRRVMNDEDNKANTRAIDSLLNFETVKYFNNEAHEAEHYDRSLRAYETAAVKNLQSLSVLNVGQAIIISSGMTLVMYMAGRGIVDGHMRIGDFVLVNTYLLTAISATRLFRFCL